MDPISSDHQNLNRSEFARKVLYQDDWVFHPDSSNEKHIESTFINFILKSFLESDDLIDKVDMNNRNKKDRESYIKIRLRKDVVEDLKNKWGYIDQRCYKKYKLKTTAPEFLKCIIETYCRLPFGEREKICLKEKFEKLESAIRRKNKVNLLVIPNIQVKITPYDIIQSKEGLYHYIVGFTEDRKRYCERISRLLKIDERKSEKATKLNKSQKDKLDEELLEFGPTFIDDKPVNIKVRLTEKGKEAYFYSVLHRPMHTKIEDDVFTFHCSEKQALFFFLRFANKAEILEPKSLRDKFIQIYENGLSIYKK